MSQSAENKNYVAKFWPDSVVSKLFFSTGVASVKPTLLAVLLKLSLWFNWICGGLRGTTWLVRRQDCAKKNRIALMRYQDAKKQQTFPTWNRFRCEKIPCLNRSAQVGSTLLLFQYRLTMTILECFFKNVLGNKLNKKHKQEINCFLSVPLVEL